MDRETSSYVPQGAGEGWTEVTFANFPLHSAGIGSNVTQVPPLAPDGMFPADGVALRMFSVELPEGPQPDSRFPIRLSYLRPAPGSSFSPRQYAPGDRPRQFGAPIVGDDDPYYASVYIGPGASLQQRAVLRRVIASLRFPRLHPGTVVNGAYVLQPPRHYPVPGSFTLIRPPAHHGPSFYLVHAPGRLPAPYLTLRCQPVAGCTPPGAFYAIAWKSPEYGGNAYHCKIRFDRPDDEFYCTNSTARWNRVGEPTRVPRGSRYRDPLPLIAAKVSWDGHVIVGGSAGGLPRAAIRLLWPNWRGRG